MVMQIKLIVVVVVDSYCQQTESVTMENTKAIWNRYKMVTQGDVRKNPL